jgi:UDP-N-acetylglucosamine diphosphorylase/glucosamine-1-phosphate N-acetyltransferase
MGIFSNDERWNYIAHLIDPNQELQIGYTTEDYLSKKYSTLKDAIEINACVIPNEEIAISVFHLDQDSTLILNDNWIAKRGNGENLIHFTGKIPVILENRWDIFQKNEVALISDFHLITVNRTSETLSETNILIGNPELLFIESGAKIEASILNTTTGPIYIGKDAEIMEGSIVRGPLAMCEHSALKLGTKVYGASTLGPHCKVGGEINNVIFQAYSNKGHEGFLGNSIIGEWCNLGADTNTSNLKNNYGVVSTYSYETRKEEKTNVQFMGLCMGDHSKCGINTMFNTATVIGVSCNIFGADFPPKYIPSFSWGGSNGFEVFKFNKAVEYANNMMNRRKLELTSYEIEILSHISGE